MMPSPHTTLYSVVLVVVLVVVEVVGSVVVDVVVLPGSVVAGSVVTGTLVVVVVEVVGRVVVVVVVVAQNPDNQSWMSAICAADTIAAENAGINPDPCRMISVIPVRHWMFGAKPPKPPDAVAPWHTAHWSV